MFKRYFFSLLAIVFLAIAPDVSNSAATLDKSVCSTADKAGGNPSQCDGQELVDSANQEISKLYDTSVPTATVGGTANAITGTTTPTATALGGSRIIRISTSNTSSVTYNDNGLGAKQLTTQSGAALSSGDLQANTFYLITYYAANDEWRVINNIGTGVAPASGPFVTIGNTGSLSYERALTAGNCVTSTDAGANSTVTIAVGSCSSANLATAVTDETGSGSAVFASSPSLTTPTIGSGGANFSGSSSGTTNLKASAAASGTLTLPAATDTLVGQATTDTLTNKSINLTSNTLTATSAQIATAVTNETGTNLLVFSTSPTLTTPVIASTGMSFTGSSSGTTSVVASAVASGTLTLPAATDTLVGKATTDTLTNKSISLGSNTLTTTSAQLATAVSDETGSGSAVFATSPTLTTPNIGVATATSVNKVAITAPATSATLSLVDGTTVTGPASSGTIMTLGNAETVTGAKTFGAAGNVGKLIVAGSTSGTTVLNASAAASGTLTLPAATDTLVGKATTDTLTNKSIDLTSNTLTATSAQVATAVTNETGSGLLVFGTSPSLTTPVIGTAGMSFSGSSSGSTAVAASAVASGTLTLPAATDTLVGKATTDTLTNKSISLGSNTVTSTSAQLATAVSDETGSGALVFATSPTFSTDVTLGSDTITDFTGFGLALSSGALGLDATGAADEFCLTYESTGPTIQWQSCGGGGGGGSPGGSNGQIQFNNAGSFDGFTASGDATINTGTGAVTIANNAVTNAKSAQMATKTIKGNDTGGTADPQDLTVSEVSTLLAGASLGLDANGMLVQTMPSAAKTSAYTIVAADRGSIVAITTNSVTLSGTAAATLGDGFWFIAANENTSGSTNTLIFDPDSSETVDGVSTSTDYSGAVRLFYVASGNWKSKLLKGGYVAFTTVGSGSVTIPNGVSQLRFMGFGGGGGGGGGQSGATATARLGGTGGGGGGRAEWTVQGGSLTAGSSYSITVGAGGTAGTGSSGASGTNGTAGGNTDFVGFVIGGGGGGGKGGVAAAAGGGGTGGGSFTAGNTAPTAASSGGDTTTTNVPGLGTAGGGSTTNVNTNPMSAQYGGGAGGGILTAGGAGGPGGSSGFGGGGGAGGAGITTGNAAAAGGTGGGTSFWSVSGGFGGAGGTTSGTSGTAGSAGSVMFGGFGGGGGGTNGTSTCGAGGAGGAPGGGGGGGAACLTGTAGGAGGAGARGELRMWYSELVPVNDNSHPVETAAA